MLDRSSEFHQRLEHQIGEWALPKSLVNDITDHLTLVTYEKGAVIFLRDSSADFLFYLFKGFVKLYLPHDNGSRTLVALARPGDLLGFVNSLDSQNRRGQVLEAHALTKCSVGLISRDHLLKLLKTLDPETMTLLLDQINTTWSSMFERFAAFIGLPFRERLQFVLDNLRLRVGVSDRRGVLLLPELTHEDLAEMIGSSRPMVSKLIADMAQDGLIIRSEKQHYIVRATNGPIRPGIAKLNEREIGRTLHASDRGAPPANDGSKLNAGSDGVSSPASMRKCLR